MYSISSTLDIRVLICQRAWLPLMLLADYIQVSSVIALQSFSAIFYWCKMMNACFSKATEPSSYEEI